MGDATSKYIIGSARDWRKFVNRFHRQMQHRTNQPKRSPHSSQVRANHQVEKDTCEKRVWCMLRLLRSANSEAYNNDDASFNRHTGRCPQYCQTNERDQRRTLHIMERKTPFSKSMQWDLASDSIVPPSISNVPSISLAVRIKWLNSKNLRASNLGWQKLCE